MSSGMRQDFRDRLCAIRDRVRERANDPFTSGTEAGAGGVLFYFPNPHETELSDRTIVHMIGHAMLLEEMEEPLYRVELGEVLALLGEMLATPEAERYAADGDLVMDVHPATPNPGSVVPATPTHELGVPDSEPGEWIAALLREAGYCVPKMRPPEEWASEEYLGTIRKAAEIWEQLDDEVKARFTSQKPS